MTSDTDQAEGSALDDQPPRYDSPALYEDLRNRLISGAFTPGSKLKPALLQDRYGCSTNTIRDTLFRLSSEGLADFQDQRGFRVPQVSDRKRHDLTEMRILLECEGACRSMQRGGVAWEARLTAAHHQLDHIERRARSAPNKDDMLPVWLSAEVEFHQALISASGSETLKSLHALVYHQFRQQMIAIDRTFQHLAGNITQHRAIVDAVIEGDPDAVRARIHDHLAKTLIAEA